MSPRHRATRENRGELFGNGQLAFPFVSKHAVDLNRRASPRVSVAMPEALHQFPEALFPFPESNQPTCPENSM
jgi:hypothetical protein